MHNKSKCENAMSVSMVPAYPSLCICKAKICRNNS